MTSLNLISSLKAKSPNTVTLGVRASTWEFGGTQFSPEHFPLPYPFTRVPSRSVTISSRLFEASSTPKDDFTALLG